MEIPPYNKEYQGDVLAWVKTAIGEGITILKTEPGFALYDECKSILSGDHNPIKLAGRSKVYANVCRKVFFQLVAVMTDVRPVWDFVTYNDKFQKTGDILTKLSKAWWRNRNVDSSIQDALKYSGAAGSGFVMPIYDPDLPGGGDIRLNVYGPKDVVPFRPTYTGNVQDWQGVFIRERRTVNELRARWPEQAEYIQATSTSLFPDDSNQRERRSFSTLEILSGGMKNAAAHSGMQAGMVDYIRFFLKDPSLHTGADPRTMGDPGTNREYVVFPLGSEFPEGHPRAGQRVTEEDARLYPRGRMILMVSNRVLYDNANPYFHGQIPLVQFSLDPVPWLLLGLPFLGDLKALQEEFTTALRGLGNGMRQWFRRGIIADKNAIARTNLRSIDTEAPGVQIITNPVAGGGVKLIDGPEFPNWMMDYVKFLPGMMEQLAGTQGIRELKELKQLPSPDSVQQFQESEDELIRLRSRNMEISIARLAELVKCCFFQFYTTKRRVQILGEDGSTLADFDYNPGDMTPSMTHGDDGYAPELDSRLPAHYRTQNFAKFFTFSVAPGSMLNISHVQKRMMDLQLYRINVLDPWSLWESFDKKNVGIPPAETIPDRLAAAKRMGIMQGIPPEIAAMQQAMIMAQAAMQAMGGGGAPPPGGGGLPPSGNPPGRPPSGAEAPHMEQRTDESGIPRQVVSESK